MRLFNKFTLGNIELQNRIAMAPMTRCRAIKNIPNELMAEHYAQRADAGLLISEGVAPSANGLGYARIPGLFSTEQLEGWKKVTEAVHHKGGKIFAQLMHTGRASHPENMPEGSEMVAPSAIALAGEMWTDSKGSQPYPTPKEMSFEDIQQAQGEYVQAAKNAIESGFDGVELHGANGYLIDQFNNPASNQRTDAYGGSNENRFRFAIEVATKVSEAIGAEKTGIRLSPYGVFNDMQIYDGIENGFEYAAKELGKLKLAYIHIVDHSSMGAPEVPKSVKTKIREAFGGVIIASGGMDNKKAENVLANNEAELVAFGKPFISNPDLVSRLQYNAELNQPDFDTFYTPGEKGYNDYPTFG